MIGILPRCNAMKCQLQSNVRYLTRYMLQYVSISGILPSYCQQMSGTILRNVRYRSYGRYI